MLANQTQLNRLLVDVAGYVIERAVALGIAAAVGVLVARHLGPDRLGLLSYCATVFTLLAPLALLGMPSILVREFSTREDGATVLASALGLQLPVAGLVSGIGLAVVVATRGAGLDVVLLAVAIAPLPLLAVAATFRSYLEAGHRVSRIAVTGIAAAAVSAVVKVAALLLDAQLWVFALAITVEALVTALGFILGVRGRSSLRAAFRRVDWIVGKDLLRESWPLLLSAVAVTLYMRADIVMLGLLSTDRETGVYVAAAQLSEVWYFLPVAALAAMRPRLARLFANGDHEAYSRLTQRFMTVAFGVSVGVAGLLVSTSDLVTTFLYGPAFEAAAAVLRVHVLAAPFVFLGTAGSQWLIDRRMTRAVLVRSLLGAGMNIVLNLLLIPRFGATGAAVATLISYSSGVWYNALPTETRPLFRRQLRALRLSWR